jgi:xanthine dehydrogenase small subunit
MSGRVSFICNDVPVDVEVAADESLLSVLRERLGILSPKDGCAPQGQCGCCTVLVDGGARVACVTPAVRVAGRVITTLEGLEPERRDQLAASFVASGGSQCGFCTPGIVMRAAALLTNGPPARPALDRALAAHLCRCTGWQTIYEAIEDLGTASRPDRDFDTAAARAALEGGVSQRVANDVPLGAGGFSDDCAPRDALVAVPASPDAGAGSEAAAGLQWVVAPSLHEARARAAKVQGRRTTIDERPPLPLPDQPPDGVRLATSWVEPAYLEPDASWCEPGGEPASPLANGGAFGGKGASPVTEAARELANRHGRAVRVVLAREDVVRLGPKRPPIAASAACNGANVEVRGIVAGDAGAFLTPIDWPYALTVDEHWTTTEVPGPSTTSHLRAVGLAERAVLVEGALHEAGFDRRALLRDDRGSAVLLDTCVAAWGGAVAGARVTVANDTGAVTGIEVRLAAGDPLDDVVLRSYAIGASHMALGWVLTEGLAVGPDGELRDLTIRSFGIVRAKDTPPITVTILDEPGPPLPRSSDAVFAAVASALWNALARSGGRPDSFPARDTRAARALRR